MTLKQEQILEAMIVIFRSLLWHYTQTGEAAPFSAIGNSKSQLSYTARNRMLKAGYMTVGKAKNFEGRGARPVYAVTDAGMAWYKEAVAVHAQQLKGKKYAQS